MSEGVTPFFPLLFLSFLLLFSFFFFFSPLPYGPMDKAFAYGAKDSGFESPFGLFFFKKKKPTEACDMPLFCLEARDGLTKLCVLA